MTLLSKITILIIMAIVPITAFGQTGDADLGFLKWNARQIEQIGKEFREKGQIGSFTFRGLNQDRAINYKVRATLMVPELIRASARFAQIRERLSDQQTLALVKEAEEAGDLVVMVELDANEGSGVIPLDWRVFLQPKGLGVDSEGAISGMKSPELKRVKALSGVFRRKYDYDVFMITFPLVDENNEPLLSPELAEIELLVGINNFEGRLSWKMPESIRKKIQTLSSKKEQNEN